MNVEPRSPVASDATAFLTRSDSPEPGGERTGNPRTESACVTGLCTVHRLKGCLRLRRHSTRYTAGKCRTVAPEQPCRTGRPACCSRAGTTDPPLAVRGDRFDTLSRSVPNRRLSGTAGMGKSAAIMCGRSRAGGLAAGEFDVVSGVRDGVGEVHGGPGGGALVEGGVAEHGAQVIHGAGRSRPSWRHCGWWWRRRGWRRCRAGRCGRRTRPGIRGSRPG